MGTLLNKQEFHQTSNSYNGNKNKSCTVVIPCYRVKSHIVQVVSKIGPEVKHIICVDDACPEDSGDFILSQVTDPRVLVVKHDHNQGVGGAMLTGYRRAIEMGSEIIVKLDGDGQMDPSLIPLLTNPIVSGLADYTKGNRFYNLACLQQMPVSRRVGNAILSLITKVSTGYWNLFDPTNGFTAIHISSLRNLQLNSISKGFFFESSLLFQLNIIRAVIIDIPMDAVYSSEKSNLSIWKVILPFAFGNLQNFIKRFFYNYVLRDFNIATVLTLIGLPLVLFGTIFGISEWGSSIAKGVPATAGTVMAAALPIIIGLQMLLSALSYDFSNIPVHPICKITRKKLQNET